MTSGISRNALASGFFATTMGERPAADGFDLHFILLV
jgi:hypothetical protein